MKRLWGLIPAGGVLLVMMSLCRPGVPPRQSDVTAEQIQLIQAQANALEERLAAGSGSGLSALAFAVSVLGPIALAVWLIYRAEQTALHHDEIIRQVTRLGLTQEILDISRLLQVRSPSDVLPHSHQARLARDRTPARQHSDRAADDEDPALPGSRAGPQGTIHPSYPVPGGSETAGLQNRGVMPESIKPDQSHPTCQVQGVPDAR